MLASFPYPLTLFGFSVVAAAALAQSAQNEVLVRVIINDDGSKTVYQTDIANHQTFAATSGTDGKTRGKIVYDLDGAGRYKSGQVLGPKGDLRFKTRYEYDPAGRLMRETQLTRDGSVRSRIVYSYDAAGHAAGYSIYDGSGDLLGRARPKKSSAVHTRP
jgi:YD repeat-containing protein